jgi:hypothetical protein
MTRIRERRCTTSRLLQALVLFLRAVPPALSPRAHREALTPSLKNRTMSGSTAETTADTIAETTAETTAGTTAEITTITRALRPRIPPMRVSGGGTQIFPARNHQSRGPTRSQPEATKRSVQLLEVTGRNDRHYNSRQLTTTRVFEDHRSNHKRRDLGNPVDLNSKVAVLLGKYGSRKGLRIAGLESGAPSTNLECNLDRMTNNPGDVPLDSLSPQEAVAVFQDEVARMMVEDGEYAEVQDIDEFLDGYLRLSSPFYVQMVQEFLRALCVDCYKRPLELPKVQQQQHYSHSEY